MSIRLSALSAALMFAGSAFAQSSDQAVELGTITVNASADASADGLPPAYAGNQVSRGGRLGILGNRDMMESPFNSSAYTSELIQDQQAKGIGDVLLNDASVRTARGFGNFQELYVVRGFPVFSDDMGYNGLYGLLPRQYVATELVERVEVLRGANAFVNGGPPSEGNIGGAVNLVPKRAPNDPLTRITAGVESGGQGYAAIDFGRRFGENGENGIRINAAHRNGGTSIHGEERYLDLFAVGFDHRGANYRLSADIGYQKHEMDEPRPSVTPTGAAPKAPDASDNFAQPWTYSNEEQVFGTLRAEVDLSDNITAWGAAGMRHGEEKNRLSNPDSAADGAMTANRFDNIRKDEIATGEAGIRGRFMTGSVSHEWAASANIQHVKSRNAYAMSSSSIVDNLYDHVDTTMPAANAFTGGSMSSPGVTSRQDSHSFALADTLGFMDDRLLLTLGARRQSIDTRGYDYDGQKNSSYKKSKVTPMVGVVFKATPELSFYANYAEALIPGGTAPAESGGEPIRNAGEVFSPYVAEQKEIGVKYDRGNLGGAIAFFTTDKPSGLIENNTYKQDGEQRNRGIELTAFGQPTDNLRLIAGLTLLDAELKKTQDGAFDGKDAIGVPDTQLNAGIEWDVPGVPGLSLNTRAIYTSKQYIDSANEHSIPSWTRVDLGARYITAIGDQVVTFRARVDNVTDRDYWASAGGYPGSNYLVLGAPRTFTLSASVDF